MEVIYMWKPIAGYENSYEVSDDGCVKSLDRTGPDGRKLSGKILKPCIAGKGYLRVCLRKDGKTHEEYIHKLVAQAFLPPRDGCNVVNHIDGNKQNNSCDNLEWVTYSENNQHAYNHQLKPRGHEFYNAKLTEADIQEIKAHGKYATYQEIADRYSVTKATIRDVLIGKTWKHIA